MDDRERIIEAFQASDVGLSVISDTEERWVAQFGPRERTDGEDTWRGTITVGRGLGVSLRVDLDPTRYGYEEVDELAVYYQENRDIAFANQVERQQNAIELLEPFRDALGRLVEEER